ncbi:hypothetical protein Cgig2_017107 [Carnegiea gigantea]|uniref:Uncharacterized protein n=1 Tax=Carnegiea gigantea TaxID=171969 RepID=A0A9Q1GVA2_9CARY|nr:hypothetical protein Cgig2_017107 [Carnegiea gigantea]
MPKKKKKADKKCKTDSNSNEELNFERHAAHDKKAKKEKEKEELSNQPVDKVVEKRKPSKDPANKPLCKKAKRDKFPLEFGRDDEPARKSAVKGEDNKKSSEQIATKNAPSVDEGRRKSAKKHEHKEKKSSKCPHQTGEQGEGEEGRTTKKAQGEGKANKSCHVSDVEPSNSSELEENDLTYECEEVDNENKQIEAKKEVAIHQHEEQASKSEEDANEKRTYQKVFIMRMSTRSFSSLVAQLNKAQAKAVRLIGFSSFLKVDLKHILGKFFEWLVESFDPYAVCFRLPYGQKFPVTAFDVCTTWVSLWGEQKSSKSLTL